MFLSLVLWVFERVIAHYQTESKSKYLPGYKTHIFLAAPSISHFSELAGDVMLASDLRSCTKNKRKPLPGVIRAVASCSDLLSSEQTLAWITNFARMRVDNKSRNCDRDRTFRNHFPGSRGGSVTPGQLAPAPAWHGHRGVPGLRDQELRHDIDQALDFWNHWQVYTCWQHKY